ncbi:MAG: alpha/beta fold hydrolase [Burkholderiaceae bacterium]|nr:alpha/beta fold hydrolase [Burkholderiaceae bacterium]
MAIEALRTADDRFAGLPAYPWAPHYVDDLPGCDGLRVHYLDEGGPGRPVALCLHGNPTWSYLYRKMIPVFLQAGLRVVAPDLIGFGRSDKPLDEAVHRFEFHRTMLQQLVARLGLRDVMLVCQDWGGLLGLTLPMDDPARYTRVFVMNTALATGESLGEGFLQWREYSNRTPDLAVGKLIARGNPQLCAEEIAAYDAPFPDARFKAALRVFANMVPDRPDAPGAQISRRALAFWREEWAGSSFAAVGVQDPVLGVPAMKALARSIRGCAPPIEFPGAGHFAQEHGDAIARAALDAFGIDAGAASAGAAPRG